MNEFYLTIAVILLLNLLVGSMRILRGPTLVDRMLVVQLFGTLAVAILVLLAESLGTPALRDVALLFAVLAALIMVAFVGLRLRDPENQGGTP